MRAALQAGELDAEALCRDLAGSPLDALPAGERAAAYEALLAHRPEIDPDAGTFALVRDRDPRRAAGAFWTPPDVVGCLLDRALAPLLAQAERAAEPLAALLALRVCDPACGAGVLLVAAGERLAARVAARGGDPPRAWTACLYGVDVDPVAVRLTRLALAQHGAAPAAAERHVAAGDALAGPAFGEPPGDDGGLDWARAFPDVATAGGFDLVLGNPPWIAHAGRAARPLPPALREAHRRRYASFARYPTTHGLFVERAAALVRDGGRVALVLPTSVADLDGYAPTRAAHDVRCEPEAELPDLGDGRFARVFQPAMALVSVRRDGGRRAGAPGSPWPLERPDLTPAERELLAWLAALPTLPAELFGERGVQTTRATRDALAPLAEAAPGAFPVLEGADVGPFRRGAPRLAIDPAAVSSGRLAGVDLLIRQTARYPIAAPAGGLAFRNSLLAGFATAEWPAGLLLALLNSVPVRWHHRRRFRDARQGMPQVKVGHLRAIPAPPALDAVRAELTALGDALGARNAGIAPAEQARLDDLAARAYALDGATRSIVWAETQRS